MWCVCGVGCVCGMVYGVWCVCVCGVEFGRKIRECGDRKLHEAQPCDLGQLT